MNFESVHDYLGSLQHQLQDSLRAMGTRGSSVYFKVEGEGPEAHVVVKEGGFFRWLASKIWSSEYDLTTVSSVLQKQLQHNNYSAEAQEVSQLFMTVFDSAIATKRLGNIIQKKGKEILFFQPQWSENLLRSQTKNRIQSVLRIKGEISSDRTREILLKCIDFRDKKLARIARVEDYKEGSLLDGVYTKINASLDELARKILNGKENTFEEQLLPLAQLLSEAESLLNSFGIESLGQQKSENVEVGPGRKQNALIQTGRPRRLLLELRSFVRKAEIVQNKDGKYAHLIEKIERALEYPTKEILEELRDEVFQLVDEVNWPEQLTKYKEGAVSILPRDALKDEFMRHMRDL